MCADEVLYTGLIEMQELDAPWKPNEGSNKLHFLHWGVSRISS